MSTIWNTDQTVVDSNGNAFQIGYGIPSSFPPAGQFAPYTNLRSYITHNGIEYVIQIESRYAYNRRTEVALFNHMPSYCSFHIGINGVATLEGNAAEARKTWFNLPKNMMSSMFKKGYFPQPYAYWVNLRSNDGSIVADATKGVDYELYYQSTYPAIDETRQAVELFYLMIGNYGLQYISTWNPPTITSRLDSILDKATKEYLVTDSRFKEETKNIIINNIGTDLSDYTDTFVSSSESSPRTFYLKTTFTKDSTNSNVVNYETMIL